jgi:hypothetical protein
MAPYTPQQNGVIERQNQTVVMAAVYTLNRTMMKDNGGKTPYEL